LPLFVTNLELIIMKKATAWILYLAGATLVIAALFIGGPALAPANHAQASTQLAPATTTTPTAEPKIGGTPTRIVVATHAIDLPVIQGAFSATTGEWTLTNNKAQFATNSSVANNKAGNTFIYGHDIPQVFKRLASLQPGETAQVYTDTGYIFTYRFRSAIDVAPSDTSIFDYNGPSILTLQTCSGIWSETRHLMTFDFIEVQKA
jgi:LPXTG-site transpeptidase (sortase) family protein